MNRSLLFLFAAAAMILAGPNVAHEMTEKYIPVGHYQELRGAETHRGTIISTNETDSTVTLRTDLGDQTYKVTATTSIWLDRSLRKETNLEGSLADCEPGLLAEVHEVEAGSLEADWIKVQITP